MVRGLRIQSTGQSTDYRIQRSITDRTNKRVAYGNRRDQISIIHTNGRTTLWVSDKKQSRPLSIP